jgi:uncharacterized damage-inducible protein DinB
MDRATLDQVFLECSIDRLRMYASRIHACLGKLDDRQVWLRGSESENAIGNLVLHLCGNLRQWIVAGVGTAQDRRDRSSEFAAREGASRDELVRGLQEAVDDALATLAQVTAERLLERVKIQGYDVTVMEDIYHVVEHFSGHTGQIVFATKAITGAGLGFYKHLDSGGAA